MFNITGEDFNKAHQRSDVDAERSSLHHTLGKGPNQASPGNHKHTDEYASATHTHAAQAIGTVIMHLGDTAPSPEYLLLNGQSIIRTDYPDLFVALGVPAGTDLTYLPDIRNRFPVGASGTKAVRTTGNTDATVDVTVNLTKTTVPVGAATGTGDVTVVTDVTANDVTVVTQATPPWLAFNFFVKAY